MKKGKAAIAVLSIICLFILVAYSACIKNNCEGVACANNGVCVDGICACPTGYEGKNCETEWFRKFSGKWMAEDRYLNDISGTINTYKIEIDGGKDTFTIYGLVDSLNGIKCKRTSLYGFSFTDQTIDSNISIRSGKGTINIDEGRVAGLFNFHIMDSLYVLPTAVHYNGYSANKNYELKKRDTTMTAIFSWTR